mmetsp:Transcript_46327/g.110283  ORF Transcript_46327/g.110283 Transcript_46327/m.110283 type:complete len:207 (+) Transcript_46327:436-1056(+)
MPCASSLSTPFTPASNKIFLRPPGAFIFSLLVQSSILVLAASMLSVAAAKAFSSLPASLDMSKDVTRAACCSTVFSAEMTSACIFFLAAFAPSCSFATSFTVSFGEVKSKTVVSMAPLCLFRDRQSPDDTASSISFSRFEQRCSSLSRSLLAFARKRGNVLPMHLLTSTRVSFQLLTHSCTSAGPFFACMPSFASSVFFSEASAAS